MQKKISTQYIIKLRGGSGDVRTNWTTYISDLYLLAPAHNDFCLSEQLWQQPCYSTMMKGNEVEGIKGSNMHTSFKCEEKTHFLSNMITIFGSPSRPSPSAPWLRGGWGHTLKGF